MKPSDGEGFLRCYKVAGPSGHLYLVYNASLLDHSDDHQPGKWYYGPYPLPLEQATEAWFDTAEDAEQAARAWDARQAERGRVAAQAPIPCGCRKDLAPPLACREVPA